MAAESPDDGQQAERAFLDAIDCNFPHEDTAVALQLIEEACRISLEAVAGVIYQLVLPPISRWTLPDARVSLLDRIDAVAADPILKRMAELGRRFVRESGPIPLQRPSSIRSEEIEDALRAFGPEQRGMYSALNFFEMLLYDTCEGDVPVALEEHFDGLRASIEATW